MKKKKKEKHKNANDDRLSFVICAVANNIRQCVW
jgi:hypothetical protein